MAGGVTSVPREIRIASGYPVTVAPEYQRAQVFARDSGACSLCGIDAESLRRDKRKLDYRARKRFEKEWGSRRTLSDAGHAIPLADGGGECGSPTCKRAMAANASAT